MWVLLDVSCNTPLNSAPRFHIPINPTVFVNRTFASIDLFTLFFQALLQKRSTSVIITWLSNLFHSMETRSGKIFHACVAQLDTGHLLSCPCCPSTGGISPAGRPVLEGPTVLQLLLEIVLLALGFLSHWHQHCQPPQLPFWSFPSEGRLETQAPPQLFGRYWVEWLWRSRGADLSFRVCTSRQQGFQMFCTVREDFCTWPSCCTSGPCLFSNALFPSNPCSLDGQILGDLESQCQFTKMVADSSNYTTSRPRTVCFSWKRCCKLCYSSFFIFKTQKKMFKDQKLCWESRPPLSGCSQVRPKDRMGGIEKRSWTWECMPVMYFTVHWSFLFDIRICVLFYYFP